MFAWLLFSIVLLRSSYFFIENTIENSRNWAFFRVACQTVSRRIYFEAKFIRSSSDQTSTNPCHQYFVWFLCQLLKAQQSFFWPVFFFNCSSWEILVNKIGENRIRRFVIWSDELITKHCFNYGRTLIRKKLPVDSVLIIKILWYYLLEWK